MALKAQVDLVTNSNTGGRYSIYVTLYDEDVPGAAIAKKCLEYSTSATEEQVKAAVTAAFAPSALAYIRKLNVKNTVSAILATMSVPTS